MCVWVYGQCKYILWFNNNQNTETTLNETLNVFLMVESNCAHSAVAKAWHTGYLDGVLCQTWFHRTILIGEQQWWLNWANKADTRLKCFFHYRLLGCSSLISLVSFSLFSLPFHSNGWFVRKWIWERYSNQRVQTNIKAKHKYSLGHISFTKF